MTGPDLLTLRQRFKLSQARLATIVGVASNTVARYERNELGITTSTALVICLKLADATGANPSRMMREVGMTDLADMIESLYGPPRRRLRVARNGAA